MQTATIHEARTLEHELRTCRAEYNHIGAERLMTRAADFLDALEYALPYLEACVPNPRNGVNADYSIDVNCVDRSRAAIAKATGA
ncbi:MAG: hypothetical protein PW999_00610 [Paraburkholderia tropica]|nr:hypothetical protein [Paraburkholderia tropica]